MTTDKIDPMYFNILREIHDDTENSPKRIELPVRFIYENDRPKKIGDGAYGSVYMGQTMDAPERESNIAIKVLYNNNEEHPRRLKALNEGELAEVLGRLVDHYHLYGQKATSPEEEDVSNLDSLKMRAVNQLKTIVQGNLSTGKMMEQFRDFYEQHANGEIQNGAQSISNHTFANFWDDLEKGANSLAVYRFEIERDINAKVRSELLRKDPNKRVGGGNIVEVWGGCNNFQEVLTQNPPLKNYFDQESISVSDYVLVTKRYDYSLKDLLERPVGKQEKNGYSVLKELSHALRVREALFVIHPASIGLKTLHSIGFFHRDIKPGNIFILVLEDQRTVETVLGDLGNLPTSEKSMDILENSLPPEKPERDYAPGTMHFRGPEQKYHRDVADVKVVTVGTAEIEGEIHKVLNGSITHHDGGRAQINSDQTLTQGSPSDQLPVDSQQRTIHNGFDPGRSGQKTALIVQDPKFKNTLIEQGDVVIFSKDINRTEYTITHVITGNSQDELNGIAFILDQVVKNTDEKTQVEFYKSQKYRTDLFSLGAVLFDMLTIGHSAEQFYEGLRKYEGVHVNEILQRYDTLRGGEIEEGNLDFSELFSPFRNENDPDNPYPERDIIEVLLKCMLYKSPGTYYQEAIQEGEDQAGKASEKLEERLNQLHEEYKRKSSIPTDESILLHGASWEGPGTSNEFFNQLIDKLQGLTPWPQVDTSNELLSTANRLMYGAYYFGLIVKFVRNEILPVNQSKSDSATLSQMLPPFITLQFQIENPKREPELQIMALAIDSLNKPDKNRLELFISSFANPFVPNEIARMRRDIRLLRPDGGNEESNQITCCYRFRDAAAVSRDVAPSDWIFVNTQRWKIVECSDTDELTITLQNGAGSGPTLQDLFPSSATYIDATYFSALNPLKYYFEMLALYLQHLIFTFSPVTQTTRDRVDIHSLLRTFEVGPKFEINEPKWDESNLLNQIHERFVHMIVKLTLHGAKGSYYQDAVAAMDTSQMDVIQPTPDMFDQVGTQAEKLYDQVREVLNLTDGLREDHRAPITSQEILPPSLEKWVNELSGENRIDIERTIKRSGQISGQDLSRQPTVSQMED